MSGRLFTIIIFCIITHSLCFGQQVFTDVTTDAGINHSFRIHSDLFGGGVVVLDFNQDDLEDLFLTSGVGPDKLYKNKAKSGIGNVSKSGSSSYICYLKIVTFIFSGIATY